MQTIYSDGTNQYLYTQILKTNGTLHEGTGDGESLSGANIVILEYKKAGVAENPATITWIETSKLWKITVGFARITQYGTMYVTINGTGIQTKILEVHVDVLENIVATTSDLSVISTSVNDGINNISQTVSSVVNSEVLDALTNYEATTTTELTGELAQTITDLLATEIKDGVSIKDVFRILDIFLTGTVINAGSGSVTFTGSDGSTISVVGDDLGNRSAVVVNLL